MPKKIRKDAWTPSQTKFLKENFGSMTRIEMAQKLGRSEGAVKRRLYDLGLRKSTEQLSKIYQRPNAGQFKPGHLPHNTAPDRKIGLRTSKSGYQDLYYRIGRANWKRLKILVWEKYNGPVPAGMVVRLIDGNPLNVSIDNLELVDRELNLFYNSPKYASRETAQIQHLRNNLTKEIKDHEQES